MTNADRTKVGDEAERCFICNEPLKEGDMVLPDVTEGLGHRACFGEDREGYVKDIGTGEPLGPDDPIPAGWPYRADPPSHPEPTSAVATMHKALGHDETLFSKGWAPNLMGFMSIPLYVHPEPTSAVQVTPTHRHKKRGTEYVLLGFGKMQAEDWHQLLPGEGEIVMNELPSVDMREVAIYRSVDDGSLWVRPREEFEDGRFEALSQSQPAPQPDAKAAEIQAMEAVMESVDPATWPGLSMVHRAALGRFAKSTPPTEAPGHTDLMVSPESIDAFLEKNPPTEAGAEEPEVARYQINVFKGAATLLSDPRPDPNGEWVKFSDYNTIVERLKRQFARWQGLFTDAEARVTKMEAALTTERERSARLLEALERAQSAIASLLLAGGLVKDDDGKVQPWWDKIIEAQRGIAASLRELKGGE